MRVHIRQVTCASRADHRLPLCHGEPVLLADAGLQGVLVLLVATPCQRCQPAAEESPGYAAAVPDAYVWPDRISVPMEDGESVLSASLEAGVDFAHVCGGRARCSTCRIRVVDGMDALSERTEREQRMAAKLDFPDEVRLACQTRVTGPIRFGRLVLDDVDIEMASQLGKGHYTGPVGREVEPVAILFADIAGFTAMSESLPAYDVVHVLNRFFMRAGAAVESRGGRVDNYMGDGLLAVFGINHEPDPALSAVQVGLELLDIAGQMDGYVSRMYAFPFQVRVGIALGDVVFGLMGAESSARETVVGDVVNTASRLESANKVTGTSILVTNGVHAVTRSQVDYGQRFDLHVAGKEGRVVAHEVRGLGKATTRAPGRPAAP